MVYLTGDTHGDIDRFRHGRLRWLGKRDIVVVLGDFGFVWDGSKEEQKKLDWLRKRPYTLLFLDGAREKHVFLQYHRHGIAQSFQRVLPHIAATHFQTAAVYII